MKRTIILVALAVMALFLLWTPAIGQGLSVICNGNVCGGTGATNYEYQLSVTSGTIGQFHVGSDDGNLADYTNIVMPTGWRFEIFGGGPFDDPFTPHGTVSPHSGVCPFYATFTANASSFEVAGGTFGFNHTWSPHDVGWEVHGVDPNGGNWHQFESWNAPVGLGIGPVHGPTVPEPMTIITLGGGLAALILRRRRA